MRILLVSRMFFILLLVIINPNLTADTKVTTLGEFIKPDMMMVKMGNLYVLEKTNIFIYSIRDFKLVKKFGREGEGPGEFLVRPFGPPMNLSFYQNNLVVNSNNKMSYFTGLGKFVREEKAPPGTVFMRVKAGYLGIGAARGNDKNQYICYRLFDKNFQNPKMLYQSEIILSQTITIKVPMNALHYIPIFRDRIYIVNGKKGYTIDCFDIYGRRLYSIEKEDFGIIKIKNSYKKKTIDWFEKYSSYKEIVPQIKNHIFFKENYPPIKSIFIENDLIYVITNKKYKGMWECHILSLKGKERKRTYIPLQDTEPFTYYPLLCDINNGIFYSLLENEDETWDLHKKQL